MVQKGQQLGNLGEGYKALCVLFLLLCKSEITGQASQIRKSEIEMLQNQKLFECQYNTQWRHSLEHFGFRILRAGTASMYSANVPKSKKI